VTLKNESAQGGLRVPEAANGIQINFCKNVECSNFGVPASTQKQPKGPGAKERRTDSYSINSSPNKRGENIPRLECDVCREKPPLRSNRAIEEEQNRLMGYLSEKPVGCTEEKCPNHLVDLKAGKLYYQAFGKTKSGSQRYRCKLCKTTFAIGSPTKQHRAPYKNIQVFRLQVNKMPLKRICEVADIDIHSLYGKIDFIHRQCLAFAADRERTLLDGMPIKRLYIAASRHRPILHAGEKTDISVRTTDCYAERGRKKMVRLQPI